MCKEMLDGSYSTPDKIVAQPLRNLSILLVLFFFMYASNAISDIHTDVDVTAPTGWNPACSSIFLGLWLSLYL